ncbi:MAG: flippase-like domain-containing protein [Acidobacteriota bacterium]|nr:flippase-like domain-containing protein [Acidobacteriota bacterium]
MAPRPSKTERGGRRRLRWALIALAVIAVIAAAAAAISGLSLHKVLHALSTARLEWMALAFALMMAAFLMRAISWHEVLRAALPGTAIPWLPVTRAAMIGVMGSAIFPGRLGEPARVLVLARRLPGRNRTLVPVLAGTLLSQTLMNLLALTILALITFSSVSIFRGHQSGVLAGGIGALALVLVLGAGPRLVSLAKRSSHSRIAHAAGEAERLLALARDGLSVFARPRHALPAVAAQLSAWVLQWLSCYAILVALSLEHHNGLVAAAAVLLAVNVTAVLPPTPSNVGVFQAACLVVLAAFGVGAGTALAYGFLLQAVELLTALAMGAPALVGEGMSWREVRRAVEAEQAAERRDGAEIAPALPDVPADATRDPGQAG